MFLEIFYSVLLGILAGIFTGLFPGIHVNLVAVTVVSISPALLNYVSVNSLTSFLVAMATTHTFVDMIPSIFLGAPEEETALSVLPGHELLMKGRGYEAAKLTVIGSFNALFLILIVVPIYLVFLPKYYPLFQQYMVAILILTSIFLILKEEKKAHALILFLISGVLGIFTLNSTIIKQPLFPLLSGLFGVSLLSVSFFKKVKIPKQTFKTEKKIKGNLQSLFSSIIAGSLVSFLPGLGAAQGAVIASSFSKLNRRAFLILLGAISTITMGLGFVALYSVSKPRHGVAVAISNLLEVFTLNHLLLFLSVMLFSGSIAVFITLLLAKFFAKKIYYVNYTKLSMIIITLIFVLSVIISGWFSLLVLVAGTTIGIMSSLLGVRKMHLMGCLILPIILFLIV